MKDKDIKNKLIKELELETPDVLDNILLNCKEKEIIMEKEKTKKKKNMFMPIGIAFAALLLVFGLSYQGYNILYKTDAIIELDVNPSIEIKVNSKRTITEANALNEDGKKILKDMNLKNSDLNVGVNAIIGSMLKEGYISELKNSILVSINSENKKEAESLQKSLSNEIDKILKTYSINSAVTTQSYSNDNETLEKAKENNISAGKAEYINRILQASLKNKAGEPYTFETLSKLTINELNVILNSKNTIVKNTTSTGEASTKGYIGTTKAKQIALNNAGVSESNTTDLEVELDYEYGKMIYEVSFDVSGKEYDYDIDATTGSIIKKDIETDDDYVAPKSNNSTSRSSSSSTNRSNSSSSSSAKSNNSSSSYITAAKAKQIALSNAYTIESNVRELEVDLDYDSGNAIYEVSFKYDGYEYDYDIDAETGIVLGKSVKNDD